MKHVSELATIDNTALPVAYVPGKSDQLMLTAFAAWRSARVRFVPKVADQHDSARIYASTLRDGMVNEKHIQDIESAAKAVVTGCEQCPSAAEFLVIVRQEIHQRNMREAGSGQKLLAQLKASDDTVDREVAKFRQAMADYSKLGR